MYTILIWDIDKGVDFPHIISYAGYTKDYKGIRDQSDHANLQMDLNMLYGWAKGNNQEFNGEKFVHLR